MKKRDGRDVPNVKTGKRRDIKVILEFDLNDKGHFGICLLQITKEKMSETKGIDPVAGFTIFRERESEASL